MSENELTTSDTATFEFAVSPISFSELERPLTEQAEGGEPVRVWLCGYGRVHIEIRHHRRTFTIEEFIVRVRAVVSV